MAATAAASAPLLHARDPLPAVAAAAHAPLPLADDVYETNTQLYADASLIQGTDYARRFRRNGVLDDSLETSLLLPRTTIIAPHGGGIEPGTSELCIAIAGYHPAQPDPAAPPAGPKYDYWLFEGLRPSNNGVLHVTSTGCDDPVAMALCGGAAYAVGLHGCAPAQAQLPEGTPAVLVGGRDQPFKQHLLREFAAAGIDARDAAGIDSLNGDAPQNIANRTLTGGGAQLEITTPLRNAMFRTNTRPQRKHTTTATFWAFVSATRAAIAHREAA
jgi:phage replication-related protein YjqB (UPF0714/DUF867 family)